MRRFATGSLLLLVTCPACGDQDASAPAVPADASADVLTDGLADAFPNDRGDGTPDSADGGDGGLQCGKPEPTLPTVTWDVLHGPVPAGTEVLMGDGTDESAAIQAILDAAAAGDVVFFPVPPAHYGLGDTITVRAAFEVRGAGFGPGSVRKDTADFLGPELRALNGITPMLRIDSEGVTVRGLRFVGPGRPLPVGSSPTHHGISASGELGTLLRGLTVQGNDLTDFDGRCIDLNWLEGYIVRNNRCTETGYAGIFVWSSRYGLITGNRVVDVKGAFVGSQGENNAYPIVITGRDTAEAPVCEYTIISDNYAEDSPEWTGIMDHGGRYTLMMDNEVWGCDFGLAFTGPGDHGLSINNSNTDSPRSSHWNIARDHMGIIGNVFRRSSFMHVGGQSLVITDNQVFEGVGSRRAVLGSYRPVSLYEARNDWGSLTDWDERDETTWLSGAAEPDAPGDLRVVDCGDERVLTWSYDSAEPHHGFRIQHAGDGGDWTTLAFRPPHDGTWNFTTNAHPDWRPLDTLRYVTTSNSTRFRIRALHGDAVSAWSNVASSE